MIPWVQLDTAVGEAGAETLRLMRRGGEFSIMCGAIELMNSRLSGSEEALATLACDRLGPRPGLRMLIGGLGMGFTLRAGLAVLAADAQVVVAELSPAVIAWARGPLAQVFAGSLEDARVRVEAADVGDLIRSGEGAYDAILLDVDNGPHGLSRTSNDGLYSRKGLEAAARALRPGGVLAVWSSAPDARFTARLEAAGYRVEEARTRARGNGRGARHVIWLAVKPAR